MKTKITAAAILIAASLTILYSFKAQQGSEEKADFAIIRTIEYPFAVSQLFLSYSNGKSEPVQELEKTYKDSKHMANNMVIITSYLMRLKKEGYKLKSVTGGDVNTTYIFERE